MSDCVYPCPCGYFQDAVKECTCSNQVITRYQVFSLLKPHLWPVVGTQSTAHDMLRFIEVPRVDYEKLSDDLLGEPSAQVQARVEAARERQRARFSDSANQREGTLHNSITCNADMRPAEIREYCQLGETSNSLMRSAMNQLQLSARAYHRVLKLARTIVDLAGDEKIAPTHLAEALQYRPKLGMR